MNMCSFEGCERHVEAKSLCRTHYGQLRRTGGTFPIGPPRQFHASLLSECLARECQNQTRNDLCWNHNRENSRMLSVYGISIFERDLLVEKQEGKCATCSSSATDVDHDHITGKVRGVLCHNCNISLGLLRDDPEILRALVSYLEKP